MSFYSFQSRNFLRFLSSVLTPILYKMVFNRHISVAMTPTSRAFRASFFSSFCWYFIDNLILYTPNREIVNNPAEIRTFLVHSNHTGKTGLKTGLKRCDFVAICHPNTPKRSYFAQMYSFVYFRHFQAPHPSIL